MRMQHKCSVIIKVQANKCIRLLHQSKHSKAELDASNVSKKGKYRMENAHREALEKFASEKLGVKELDDWYSVKATDVWNKFKFLQKHGSLSNTLKRLYPEHNWDPLRFTIVPRGHWCDENAQRAALEKFGREKLGIKELDDWHAVSSESVYSELTFIRNKYNGSLFSALSKLYPHHKWDRLKFSRVAKGYWNDLNTQRDALERLGREKFGVKELDDWHNVAAEDVKNELSFINKYYKGSLLDALKVLYPQHDWNSARLSSERNQLEQLGRERFGVKELDDWYAVTAKNVFHALSFMKKYGSLCDALKSYYPQHNWDPLRFQIEPRVYWSDEKVQRDALEKFGREKLGVKELDDWYAVSTEHVKNEVKFIRSHYNGSLFAALEKLYPHHKWDRSKFSRVAKGYWNDLNTQRDALERLGREKFGVKELDDWYNVAAEDVKSELSFVANYYGGKMLDVLKNLYPDHNWIPLRFSTVPRGYWTDDNKQREALEQLGKQLGVKELDDWYKVSTEVVKRQLSFIDNYFNGSLMNALKKFYPQHEWDTTRFARVPKGYWQQPEILQYYRNLFTDWKQTHNIRTVSEWHELPPSKLQLFKRVSVGIFGTKMKLLESWFPETLWHSQFVSQHQLKVSFHCCVTRMECAGVIEPCDCRFQHQTLL